MKRPIGYYVHHHGDGHRQRALALARALDWPVTLLGTGLAGRTEGMPCIDLPDDRPSDGGFDGADGVERPQALHYAPIDHGGVRDRVARITGWIAEARPLMMIVDVSVEVAMLARLASVPTLYVRLSGRRLDPPHLDAFRGALGLLAPFAEPLDDPETPAELRSKTFYAPGILALPITASPEPDLIVGIVGKGGGLGDGARWAEAARAMPGRRWRVLGECTPPPSTPPNLEFTGWIDRPEAEIARAGLVVGGAGDGVVGSILAAGRPFVCLPEPRPYAEQVAKAERLAACGAARVHASWPEPAAWPHLIAEAEAQDPQRRSALHDPQGAAHAAAWIRSIAARLSEPALAVGR